MNKLIDKIIIALATLEIQKICEASRSMFVNNLRNENTTKNNGGQIMSKQEAYNYILNIADKLGSMAIEQLSDKDGNRLREAAETLYLEE